MRLILASSSPYRQDLLKRFGLPFRAVAPQVDETPQPGESPATLALRLAANMIAGHLLLVLCFSATNFLFLEMSGVIQAAGAVTLLAGVAFTLFEVFIAFLQAYIFTLLTAVYINLSVDSH